MLDTKKNRIRIYERALLSYGITTLVALYNRNKEKGNIFDCEIIADIIKEHYKNDALWGIKLCADSVKEISARSEKNSTSISHEIKQANLGADAIQAHLNKFIQ